MRWSVDKLNWKYLSPVIVADGVIMSNQLFIYTRWPLGGAVLKPPCLHLGTNWRCKKYFGSCRNAFLNIYIRFCHILFIQLHAYFYIIARKQAGSRPRTLDRIPARYRLLQKHTRAAESLHYIMCTKHSFKVLFLDYCPHYNNKNT